MRSNSSVEMWQGEALHQAARLLSISVPEIDRLRRKG